MKSRISLTLLSLATLSIEPQLHSQSGQGPSQGSSFNLVEATLSDIEQAYRSQLKP